MAEPDPRNSLRHVLAIDPLPETSNDDSLLAEPEGQEIKHDDTPQPLEDLDAAYSKAQLDPTASASANLTSRRNANGSVSSVYSGNKIRHLKKDDGEPLWRKDIQYDFLRTVFADDRPVFHRISDGSYGHSFADIYLEAMARSSKCSKILKDKLLTDRPAAINMAMVCLLVNVGRMNTTLNFFPEMRAQLRTYHSIPSLQARQDPNSYKQLQDAPRLKSILKGATEDFEQPSTLDHLMSPKIPRTNPVNLIFILAQYAPKVSELHFTPPRDFFDLVVRSALSSKSRANAFLWLMWWYLESDFSQQAAQNNPFGPGDVVADDEAIDAMSAKLPPFEYLTEEQAALENVDTEEEREFGEQKRRERMAILSSDITPIPTSYKRPSKKSKHAPPASDDDVGTPARDTQSPMPSLRNGGRTKSLGRSALEPLSDTDRTRSASPPAKSKGSKGSANLRITTLLNGDGSEEPVKGSNRVNRTSHSRLSKNKAEVQRDIETPEASSPPASMGKPVGLYLPYNGLESLGKKSRPLTAHQVALERYRKERVDFILDRRLQQHYSRFRARRERDGAILHAWRRCAAAPDGYDSEDEALAASHVAGLGQPNYQNGPLPEMLSLPTGFARSNSCYWDRDDIGEEAFTIAQTLRQAGRRLDRWDGRSSGFRAVRPAVKSGPHHFGSKASLLTTGASSSSSSVGRRAAVKREDASERRNSSRPSSPRVGSSKKSARRKEQRRIKNEGIEFTEPVVLQEKSLLQHQETVDDVLDTDEIGLSMSAGGAGDDGIAGGAGAAAAAAAASDDVVGDAEDTVDIQAYNEGEANADADVDVDVDERAEILDDGVDDVEDEVDDDETEEEEEEEEEEDDDDDNDDEDEVDVILEDGEEGHELNRIASGRGDVSMVQDG